MFYILWFLYIIRSLSEYRFNEIVSEKTDLKAHILNDKLFEMRFLPYSLV